MKRFHLLAVLLGATGALTAQGTEDTRLSAADKLYGLSLIWKEVDYNFAFFDQVPELDWDRAYREAIPEVLAAETTLDYYRVLQRFVARLKDGHTNVYLPRTLAGTHTDLPPVELREVEHRAIVSNVEASLAARLPIGSEVLAVDGTAVAAYLAERVFPFVCSSTEHVLWDVAVRGSIWQGFGLLAGPPGSACRISIATPQGEERALELTRDRSSRRIEWARATPRPSLFAHRSLEGGIAYVELGSFDDREIVDSFEAALPELAGAKGLIVDIRRNPGGSTGNAAAIARHLTDRPLPGSSWRTRSHVAAYKAWGQRADQNAWAKQYEPYARGEAWHEGSHETIQPAAGDRLLVPTAVLISRTTGSAAEDFLVYLDALEHVVLVGEPTNGSTGQPLDLDLPGGGRARVCTKRDTFPDGRDFVGFGVQPDVPVAITVADVRAERDPVLVRAQEVVRARIREGGR